MRIPWTAPIAAIVAAAGVERILGLFAPIDTTLGGMMLAATIVILILPRALSPARERVASAAQVPLMAVSHPADVVEADVRQPREAA